MRLFELLQHIQTHSDNDDGFANFLASIFFFKCCWILTMAVSSSLLMVRLALWFLHRNYIISYTHSGNAKNQWVHLNDVNELKLIFKLRSVTVMNSVRTPACITKHFQNRHIMWWWWWWWWWILTRLNAIYIEIYEIAEKKEK